MWWVGGGGCGCGCGCVGGGGEGGGSERSSRQCLHAHGPWQHCRAPFERAPAQASRQASMVGKCEGYSHSNSMPAKRGVSTQASNDCTAVAPWGDYADIKRLHSSNAGTRMTCRAQRGRLSASLRAGMPRMHQAVHAIALRTQSAARWPSPCPHCKFAGCWWRSQCPASHGTARSLFLVARCCAAPPRCWRWRWRWPAPPGPAAQ